MVSADVRNGFALITLPAQPGGFRPDRVSGTRTSLVHTHSQFTYDTTIRKRAFFFCKTLLSKNIAFTSQRQKISNLLSLIMRVCFALIKRAVLRNTYKHIFSTAKSQNVYDSLI